jgi:DNA gyrase subunit B
LDSAGGSAKEGRDRTFQAIFSLRGKPLNTNDADMSRVLDPKSKGYNREVSDLLGVIGAGSGEHYRDDKRRYGRIVIMSDADIDGERKFVKSCVFI